MAAPEPVHARFARHVTQIDESQLTVVYLCDDPEIGIGWRVRRIREVKIGDEVVKDAEEAWITAAKAAEILRISITAEVMKQTQSALEFWEEHEQPEIVAHLPEAIEELWEEIEGD